MFWFQFQRSAWRSLARLVVVAAIASPVAVHADDRGAAVDSSADDVQAARLPDGYFTGPLLIVADDGTTAHEVGALRLQIVHGFIVSAVVTTTGTPPSITLAPMTAPDDPELRMNGRADSGFVRMHGEFWDTWAAMGSFEGVIANKKARGIWSVTRR